MSGVTLLGPDTQPRVAQRLLKDRMQAKFVERIKAVDRGFGVVLLGLFCKPRKTASAMSGVDQRIIVSLTSA